MNNSFDIEFNPCNLDSWAERLGLPMPSEGELQKMYERSRGFLLRRHDELIAYYGWAPAPNDGNMLFVLEKEQPCDYEDGFAFQSVHNVSRFQLPFAIADILDTWEADRWGSMFSDTTLFNPCRQRAAVGHKPYVLSDCPPPLIDLFQFIQSLVPGLLIVAEKNDADANSVEFGYYHALPDREWIQQNKGSLQHALGTARFRALLEAAEGTEAHSKQSFDYERYDDQGICGPLVTHFPSGFEHTLPDPWSPDSDNTEESSSPHYTSDDKEFGYCDDDWDY
ncbi:hypothetical protein V5O48_004304 [Marasmius crinis-equi]|uniref:Uncharacterized protein n=1 Tax=Marasmius crinis-equi TaxID=585013 RepID=A0ABR3FQI4_9AGAR